MFDILCIIGAFLIAVALFVIHTFIKSRKEPAIMDLNDVEALEKLVEEEKRESM